MATYIQKILVYSFLLAIIVPQVMQSLPLVNAETKNTLGSGSIEIQEIKEGTVKLHFVFDEKTTSSNFQDRSTNWLVIHQYNMTTAIPIGRADPDWTLIGTNNVTSWHWQLEKTYYLEHQNNGNHLVNFPNEEFKVTFYIATNFSRSFHVESNVPNFSTQSKTQEVDFEKFLIETGWSFEAEGCPIFLELEISIFHNLEYKIIIGMLYTIAIIILALCVLLVIKKDHLINSDFLRVASSILLFAPTFLFTFRNSVAPPYLTSFDL